MTELSFLLDLVLTEKLSKQVKDKILARVRDLEANPPVIQMPFVPSPIVAGSPVQSVMVNGVQQSPSTAAAMARHAQGINGNPAAPVPGPGTLVASPAAAQAIQSRNQALAEAISGKPEPGRTSPRKF